MNYNVTLKPTAGSVAPKYQLDIDDEFAGTRPIPSRSDELVCIHDAAPAIGGNPDDPYPAAKMPYYIGGLYPWAYG